MDDTPRLGLSLNVRYGLMMPKSIQITVGKHQDMKVLVQKRRKFVALKKLGCASRITKAI
jgi:hypothetical protein